MLDPVLLVESGQVSHSMLSMARHAAPCAALHVSFSVLACLIPGLAWLLVTAGLSRWGDWPPRACVAARLMRVLAVSFASWFAAGTHPAGMPAAAALWMLTGRSMVHFSNKHPRV